MTEHEEIIQRLAAFGQEPVDTATAGQHLGQMALATPAARAGRFARLRVAAALGAGIMIGGTGLAGAGVLDDVAEPVLSTVGLGSDDDGVARYQGAECGVDENGEPWENHGAYVAAHPGDEAAAESDCGKPLSSLSEDEPTTTTVAPDPSTTTTTAEVSDGEGEGEGCSGFGEAHEEGQPKPLKSDYCDNGNPDPHKVGPDAEADDAPGAEGRANAESRRSSRGAEASSKGSENGKAKGR